MISSTRWASGTHCVGSEVGPRTSMKVSGKLPGTDEKPTNFPQIFNR